MADTAATPAEIRQRWRKPVRIHYVKPNRNEAFILNNEARQGLDLGFSEDDIERMRQGYVCAICYEPHETPFPARCSLCGFEIKERQRPLLEKLYAGVAEKGRDYGSSIDFGKEIDRLDDELERDNWAEHPTSGIVVPRSVAS